MRLETSNSGPSSPDKTPTFEELQGLFEIVSEGKRVWEETFDAIVDPVLIVSTDYQIQRANLAAADSAHVDIRKFVGKRCYEAFAKRESPCPGCPMPLSRKKSAPERRRLQPYQDHREFVASAFPVRDKAGKDLEMAVMQYQDMSAIRKLEEQLLQNEKMVALGHFASGIAHDINNPLTGVLAFAQLAMQGVEVGSQVHQDLKEIENSALRCKKIIEDLLLFSRPLDKGDRTLVDLSKLVKDLLPNLEVQWKNSEYRLRINLENLPPVLISRTKFEQVFTNLLTNAFQSLAPGGEISITGGEEDDNVYVEVEDNGEGISKKNLERVFDPYFTTKGKKGGTGLGLPTANHIVREHGGRIDVKSSPGKGTAFRVSIPKGASP